ncbi:hypothetical protein [Embleya sp. NPDC005575]|uniref:hypothetical protein n=1 Tax=Embleya sp. NPDC005575 TaxID=3156892 RepID=UPI0033A3B051
MTARAAQPRGNQPRAAADADGFRQIVHRHQNVVHRAYQGEQRLDWHQRHAYASVLGRLHEDIMTLDGRGAPRELLSRLSGEMAGLIVAHGRLPTFGADIAGTAWQLRTPYPLWDEYRRVLCAAPWFTRYREPFLLEYGRLALEDLDIAPNRTEPQP